MVAEAAANDPGHDEPRSMKDIVNVRDAKLHLSRLLKRVEQGEVIVIARAGHPIARLVPLTPTHSPRMPGLYAGQVWIAEDFDSDEMADLFEGGDDLISDPPAVL